MRAPPVLLLAASLVAVGCDGGATRPVVDAAPQIEGVRTDGERGLLLTFVGGPPVTVIPNPCAKIDRAEVDETDDRVVVTIRTLPANIPLPREFACTAMGYFRTVSANLSRPLGDRRVIDRATGQQRRPFDSSTLRRPSFLPEGWSLRNEGPGFDQPERSATWRRTFGPPPLPPIDNRCAETAAAVTVSQGPPAPLPIGGEPVTVRGMPGVVVHDPNSGATISWVERGQAIAVADTPGCAGTPPTSVQVLLLIAERLE
jgi:hypothetical protein